MRNLDYFKKQSIPMYKGTIGMIEAKASSSDYPDGYVEGLLSTFNNVDLDGDVILPGAWKKTIKEKMASGGVPLMQRHFYYGGGSPDVVGTIREARETKEGLWVRGGFAGDPSSQGIRIKVAGGHIKSFSAGFRVIQYRENVERPEGGYVTEFVELGLMEGTLTPFPANTMALISGVKSLQIAASEISEEIKDGRIERILEQLAKLEALIPAELLSQKTEESDPVESEPEEEEEKKPPLTDNAPSTQPATEPLLLSSADLMAIEAEVVRTQYVLETLRRSIQ